MAVELVVLVGCPEDPADRPAGIERLADRVAVRYTDATGLPDAIVDADVLLVWDFFSGAVHAAWHRANRLTWIHVAAAGVDKLLFDELADSGVVVTNAAGTFDRPIAEYVLACLLAHAKQLRATYRLQDQRVWQHRETLSLAGARAMVVGTGGIGQEIGRLLTAAGLSVRGAARAARPGDGVFEEVVASAELARHVRNLDYLIVATPLTPVTRGLVDAAVLDALPDTAYLVNIARGPCVDQHAVLERVRAGTLAGAALDVFDVEPLPAGDPLWDDERILVSPHMSGDVAGWRDSLARQFLDNAERWLAGAPLGNVVDTRLGFAQSPK